MRSFIVALIGYQVSAIRLKQEDASSSPFAGLTEEELYGNGLRENIKEEIVLKVDFNQDGYGTPEEFLERVSCPEPDRQQLLDEFGTDYRWWRDGDYMARALKHMVDPDGDNKVDEEKVKEILSAIGQGHVDMEVVKQAFISDPAVGFTVENFGNMMEAWAYADPIFTTEPPSLHDFTHEQLYGGLRGDLESFVLQVDRNQDGVATAREWLEAISCPIVDELLHTIGDEATFMWWRDNAFMTKGL